MRLFFGYRGPFYLVRYKLRDRPNDTTHNTIANTLKVMTATIQSYKTAQWYAMVEPEEGRKRWKIWTVRLPGTSSTKQWKLRRWTFFWREMGECWEIIDFKPAADDWACPSFSKVNTTSSTTCLVVEKRVSLQTCRISWLKDVRNSKAWTSGILQFGRFVAARQRIRVKCWSSDSPMTCPTIWVGFETLPGVLIGTWTSLTLDAWRHYYFWIWPTTNMKRFALRNLHVGLFQPGNQFLLYHIMYHYSL